MCPTGGGSTWEPTAVRHARALGDVTFASTLPARRCATCEHVSIGEDALAAFRRAVAAEVARRGPVCNETFRWMRAAVPISTAELARLLEVSTDVLRRWERGGGSPDRAAWLIVGGLVLESFDAGETGCIRIAEGRPPGRRQVEVDIERAQPSLSRVLRLLAGPVKYLDSGIARVLGVSVDELRVALEKLEARGLVERTARRPEGHEWVTCAAGDVERLLERARAAGVAVDAPLPLRIASGTR